MVIEESTVRYGSLAKDEREQLVAEMLELDAKVFPTAKPEDLHHYLDDPRAQEVRIVLYRCGGALVGQNIIPFLGVRIDGRQAVVITSVAGLLPEARGGLRTQLSAMREVAKWRILHPFTTTYMVVGLLQPRVYEQFVDASPRVHPRPGTPTPAVLTRVLDAVGGGDATMQKRRGYWIQRGLPVPVPTRAEARRLATSTPNRDFFARQVDHTCGEALMVAAPIDSHLLASASARLLARRFRRTRA